MKELKKLQEIAADLGYLGTKVGDFQKPTQILGLTPAFQQLLEEY